MLEYHWGPDWVVWDAHKTLQQHAQHVEYTLQRETDDKTRVRFEFTLEPSAPIPEFLVNRARKKILYAATEGLRRKVMAVLASTVGLADPSRSRPSRRIASSSVSSRLQNVNRTK